MENQLALLDQAKSTLVDLAIKFGPKVVVAILFLVAGFYAGRAVGRMFDRSLSRLHLEPPVRTLLVRIVRDRKSTRLNSSHSQQSRMPSSA